MVNPFTKFEDPTLIRSGEITHDVIITSMGELYPFLLVLGLGGTVLTKVSGTVIPNNSRIRKKNNVARCIFIEPRALHDAVKNYGFVRVENIKEDVMEEKFRQKLLRESSAQSVGIDESKRPTYEPVNESFRKLAVD